MPDAIAGFFFMAGASEHEQGEMRKTHNAFLAAYRFPTQRAPPLMALDLKNGGDAPFTLVPAEHSWAAGEG